MKNKITIGIVGGGVAGLVFANFLKDSNRFKIKIFEKKRIHHQACNRHSDF